MVDYVFLEEYVSDIEVLFVEDDELIRNETKELLEDIFQKNICIAVDGEDGLDKYNKYYKEYGKYYDLVITDIQMPKMNGIELTKEIYKQNEKQSLVVLSAHNDSEYLMKLINFGISQFILKPLEYDSFINVIYKVSKKIYEKSHISNNQEPESNNIILNDNLYWDKINSQLFLNNEIFKLTKKEFLLMEILLKTPDKTHTNEEILLYLYADQEEKSPDISNLKNIVARLRKKVPSLNIENIYSFGYRIIVKN